MEKNTDHLVEELSHRRAIADVLAHYCDRLDAYDIDAVAAVFTPDAVTDYGPGRGGEVRGRDAIRARIAEGQAVFRRTHHQLGQQTIRFVVGDTDETAAALATSATTAWHERHDGTQDRLGLRYLDRLTLTETGWKIASRRVEVSMVDGFADTAWHWWPRNPPVDQ